MLFHSILFKTVGLLIIANYMIFKATKERLANLDKPVNIKTVIKYATDYLVGMSIVDIVYFYVMITEV